MAECLQPKLLGVEDVKSYLGVKNTIAYGIIRDLNEELSKKGYFTIRGKVPEKYFYERFYS